MTKHAKLGVGVGVVLVLIIAATLLQRRYLPTCDQVAEHFTDLKNEIGGHRTPGSIRQLCVDDGWSRGFKSRLMAADTSRQADDTLTCRNPDDTRAYRDGCSTAPDDTESDRELWFRILAAALVATIIAAVVHHRATRRT
jgi:hypothetical protein